MIFLTDTTLNLSHASST